MNKKFYDFVIVGGGVVGLTVARALLTRRVGTVCVLEKEKEVGLHASGRNSGILHAGIYYSPGTLKARICVSGARRMFEYALEHGIPVKKTGKVIVATSPDNVSEIDRLYHRAVENGVRVEKIDPARLFQIEPEARTFGWALYSPDTAVIDPKKVMETLQEEVLRLGAFLDKRAEASHFNVEKRMVRTQDNVYGYGHLVNSGGLQADKIARKMGVGKKYRILPFKGIYRKLTPSASARIRGSIYPVPDPNMPFLGVHITRTIHDEVMLGPTAIPALGRENYGIFRGMDLRESPVMLTDFAHMVAKNTDNFSNLAKEELFKYSTAGFLQCVQKLAPTLKKTDILPSDKIGIRAQLVECESRRLVMDFVIEDGPHSTHILNAISPAFTSSLSFADVVADRIISRRLVEGKAA